MQLQMQGTVTRNSLKEKKGESKLLIDSHTMFPLIQYFFDQQSREVLH